MGIRLVVRGKEEHFGISGAGLVWRNTMWLPLGIFTDQHLQQAWELSTLAEMVRDSRP